MRACIKNKTFSQGLNPESFLLTLCSGQWILTNDLHTCAPDPPKTDNKHCYFCTQTSPGRNLAGILWFETLAYFLLKLKIHWNWVNQVFKNKLLSGKKKSDPGSVLPREGNMIGSVRSRTRSQSHSQRGRCLGRPAGCLLCQGSAEVPSVSQAIAYFFWRLASPSPGDSSQPLSVRDCSGASVAAWLSTSLPCFHVPGGIADDSLTLMSCYNTDLGVRRGRAVETLASMRFCC